VLNDDDIVDRLRQPRPQLTLLFHGEIDPSRACIGSSAPGIALRVLSTYSTVLNGAKFNPRVERPIEKAKNLRETRIAHSV